MIRSSQLAHKRVAELQPGELLRISFGTTAGIAVFMKHLNSGGGLVGVIKSADFNRPMTWYALDDGERVMSYGPDWFLEEVHGDATAAGRRHVADSARLHVQGHELVMTFIPPEHQVGQPVISFGLSTLDKTELSRHAAPVVKWQIWESEGHRDRGGAPLVDMTQPA
ncbi:hypothetical protein A6U87_17615 [Rhizobium sp. AC44/96]|uniref:hypothetical protein n=1 Tax=Rhizobium sp. AC44/96 TaxID=1841654 RepID=UPI00080F8B9E|nr:hypothetical protein [Rhizobium sp. AC44/96]OCJ03752.1 hypothetical protein A6U87_17615 [Rhizobium sp. AC44/96]